MRNVSTSGVGSHAVNTALMNVVYCGQCGVWSVSYLKSSIRHILHNSPCPNSTWHLFSISNSLCKPPLTQANGLGTTSPSFYQLYINRRGPQSIVYEWLATIATKTVTQFVIIIKLLVD